jgi:hypothetical protein
MQFTRDTTDLQSGKESDFNTEKLKAVLTNADTLKQSVAKKQLHLLTGALPFIKLKI